MPENWEYVVYRVPRVIPSADVVITYFGSVSPDFVARGTATEVALAILATVYPNGAFTPPRVEAADEPVWANELDSE